MGPGAGGKSRGGFCQSVNSVPNRVPATSGVQGNRYKVGIKYNLLLRLREIGSQRRLIVAKDFAIWGHGSTRLDENVSWGSYLKAGHSGYQVSKYLF